MPKDHHAKLRRHARGGQYRHRNGGVWDAQPAVGGVYSCRVRIDLHFEFDAAAPEQFVKGPEFAGEATMAAGSNPALDTKRRVIAQVTICSGCCCGNTERGLPAVPVDWLKSEWRKRGLLKRV